MNDDLGQVHFERHENKIDHYFFAAILFNLKICVVVLSVAFSGKKTQKNMKIQATSR